MILEDKVIEYNYGKIVINIVSRILFPMHKLPESNPDL